MQKKLSSPNFGNLVVTIAITTYAFLLDSNRVMSRGTKPLQYSCN